MFLDLFENVRNLNEMKDEPLVTITKVVDDDTGIWANDEFECALSVLYQDEYRTNKEAGKRLADELRKVADMIERESNES